MLKLWEKLALPDSRVPLRTTLIVAYLPYRTLCILFSVAFRRIASSTPKRVARISATAMPTRRLGGNLDELVGLKAWMQRFVRDRPTALSLVDVTVYGINLPPVNG